MSDEGFEDIVVDRSSSGGGGRVVGIRVYTSKGEAGRGVVLVDERGKLLCGVDAGATVGAALDQPDLHLRETAPAPTPVISFIEIDNRTKLADARIRKMIHQKIGEPLDTAVVERDFAQLYGLGDFEQVDYALVERDGRTGMLVTATEKSWAKDYFRVGLSLEHDFSGRSTFTLGGAVSFTGLDANGAERRSELSIGAQQRLYTEYYQPLQPTPGWFVMPQAEYSQRNYYAYANGSATSEYRLTTATARFLVGSELGNVGMLAAGVQFGRGELQRLVGSAAPSDLTYNIGGGQILFMSD
ncbi:hypothetical protein JZU48_03645, partial [bacterium]|nr:hypothetical protein [bacterium]